MKRIAGENRLGEWFTLTLLICVETSIGAFSEPWEGKPLGIELAIQKSGLVDSNDNML